MVDSGLGEKHSVHDKRPHTLECHWLQFERRSLDVEDSYMSVCVCGGGGGGEEKREKYETEKKTGKGERDNRKI